MINELFVYVVNIKFVVVEYKFQLFSIGEKFIKKRWENCPRLGMPQRDINDSTVVSEMVSLSKVCSLVAVPCKGSQSSKQLFDDHHWW